MPASSAIKSLITLEGRSSIRRQVCYPEHGRLCPADSDGLGEFLYPDLIPANATLAESITFIDKEEEKVEFMRFVRQMLQWEPEKRKTARELFDDPWLVNAPRRKSSETNAA
jgi:serine/threonine protein kinase